MKRVLRSVLRFISCAKPRRHPEPVAVVTQISPWEIQVWGLRA